MNWTGFFRKPHSIPVATAVCRVRECLWPDLHDPDLCVVSVVHRSRSAWLARADCAASMPLAACPQAAATEAGSRAQAALNDGGLVVEVFACDLCQVVMSTIRNLTLLLPR